MLQRIIAIHANGFGLLHHELKCQSSEWHTKNSPGPEKFHQSQNCAKMLIFAYDFWGVMMAHRVTTGETVNKEYFKMYIRKILCQAIRRKRQEITDRTPLILHNNTSPLKANIVKVSYRWEVLDHPPCSPDLSPPDFDLFPKLKEPLRGICYISLEELECAVNREVRQINLGSLATGIQAKYWSLNKSGRLLDVVAQAIFAVVLWGKIERPMNQMPAYSALNSRVQI